MRRRVLLKSGSGPTPEYYFRVTPVGDQWISVGSPITYRIESNTTWNIHESNL